MLITVKVRRNTESELKTDLDKVVVKNIECTGYDSNENQHPSMTATVTFEFVGRGGMNELYMYTCAWFTLTYCALSGNSILQRD